MVRYLIYLLFVIILFGEYLFGKVGLESKLFAILPEMISVVLAVYAGFYFAFNKGAKIQWRYLFFFLSFGLHIAIGIIGNQVQPLAVLSGMRTYLKFLPLYFLPLVFNQTNGQIKKQLLLLLALAILQLPLALYQRLIEYTVATGDYVAGTLETAPILTIFLVCTISVIIGFYVRNQLSVKMLIVLLIMTFIPTAINETKATVILLPMAVMIPTFFDSSKNRRIRMIATVVPIGLILLFSFHFMYKIFYGYRSDVVEFYTTGEVTGYLYKDAQANEVTGERETEVGRIDSIILAYKQNAKDFFRLIWGVGVGNAAPSFSRKFTGKYHAEFSRLGGKKNGISNFMWEIGLLGTGHIFWFFLLVFSDALYLRKEKDDIIGFLAPGWLGVTAIIAISMFYQNIITKNGLIYPFFYFSGLLAAHRYMLQRRPIQVQ